METPEDKEVCSLGECTGVLQGGVRDVLSDPTLA